MVFGIRWVFENIGASFGRSFSQNKEESVTKEKDGDSLKPTTDTLKVKVVGDKGKENEKQAQRVPVR